MDFVSVIIAFSVGIGLAAACGFRVFLPPAIVSLAANLDWMTLEGQFSILGTWTAFAILTFAVLFEVGGYYIPWIDNLLDSIATPVAGLAGILMSASVMTDFSPMMQWSIAIIAGGGAAGTIQLGTVATRMVSSGTTGGLGNPIVATVEAAASIFLVILALLAPILALIAFFILIIMAIRLISKWRAKKKAGPIPA